MMVSCGSEIRTSWKVIIKSWKVEAQDKSGQSFAQFYARPEIPPVSVFFFSFGDVWKKMFLPMMLLVVMILKETMLALDCGDINIL